MRTLAVALVDMVRDAKIEIEVEVTRRRVFQRGDRVRIDAKNCICSEGDCLVLSFTAAPNEPCAAQSTNTRFHHISVQDFVAIMILNILSISDSHARFFELFVSSCLTLMS
jgi:hypothetical protein